MAAAELVRADAEGGDGAVHRALRQLAGLGQALSQADDAGECVDDGERAVARSGDQKPAIIGTEVDRAIGVAMRSPPFWGADRCRGPGNWSGLRRSGDASRHLKRPFYPSPPERVPSG